MSSECRTDIFLDFLNRDSRQLYGLFNLSPAIHRRVLSTAINAAVVICESRCIVPPGFFLECDIAMDVLLQKKLFLQKRIIEFPIRETSLFLFAEKKRTEYKTVKKAYAGLFDDKRII